MRFIYFHLLNVFHIYYFLQVSWVDYKCQKYFERLINTTSDYPSLRYSVDTAIALKDTTETYIELVVPSLQHMETECLFDFLRSFLSEPELNKGHLNFILRLTRHHTAISLVLR